MEKQPKDERLEMYGEEQESEKAMKKSGTTSSMAESLKKAVSEMLVLCLLDEREMYVSELIDQMEARSDGTFAIAYPYALLLRLEKFGYALETHKRTAPDGRRRQYFGITEDGREYLRELVKVYSILDDGVQRILRSSPNYGVQFEI